MKKMIFPVITEFESKLPYYIEGVGCSYEQEYINRPNGHPHYQWIQCRSGRGELKINNMTCMVTENQGMLLFPDTPHEYYAISDNWEVDWVIFQGRQIPDFFTNTSEITKSGVYFVSQPHTISSKIAMVYDIEQSGSPTKSLESSRIIYDILMDLLKFTSQKYDQNIANQYNKLKPLFDYIEHNYDKALSLTELSQVVNLTPQYLCSSFKKTTSQTVFQYINLFRIKKSKELLLQNKSLQIKELARIVGFQDVSYFCSAFRKSEQMSPIEFKRLHVL